jgi:hypothetical protein
LKQAERGEFALRRLHEVFNMAETRKFGNWKAPSFGGEPFRSPK